MRMLQIKMNINVNRDMHKYNAYLARNAFNNFRKKKYANLKLNVI